MGQKQGSYPYPVTVKQVVQKMKTQFLVATRTPYQSSGKCEKRSLLGKITFEILNLIFLEFSKVQ